MVVSRLFTLGALLLGSFIPFTAAQGQACNGYPEYCSKHYNELTYVLTHNSYAYAANPASTQMCAINVQLQDGVRALKLSAVKPSSNSTTNTVMHLCHTDCSILDAGTAVDTLTTIVNWLKSNPNEVISIFWNIPNNDFTAPDFVSPYESSGLLDYSYVQAVNNYSWPTLNELIASGKRVINFIETGADQSAVPWLHSEFDYIIQTPYENTNETSFSCVYGRPSDPANPAQMMYGMNHYLYGTLPWGQYTIQVPQSGSANKTNSRESLGLEATECTQAFGKQPNFLIVDFYNRGTTFEIAAALNNVTYSNTSALMCDTQSTMSGTTNMDSSASLLSASITTAALALVALIMTFM
ncbi:PLC-like phosphodiesterase [Dichotomocladium elegans]|nr:PLC-like phosphodiesterase [Dichotomocladium elegans]